MKNWLGGGGSRFKMSEDVGIDLGTASFLVYTRSGGLVLQEPSVIARTRDGRQVVAVGEAAYRMLGRTPANMEAVRPIRDGVIAEGDLAEVMLRTFLERALGPRHKRPRMMIGIPAGVTEVEKRAVMRATMSVGASKVWLIDEPLAAAIGAGLPVTEPSGSMVIDIGGGSSDIAVISLGGIVVSRSLRVAGDAFDESIVRFVRRQYGVAVGERTAEELKVKVGAAQAQEDEIVSAEVRGRELTSGLPTAIMLSTHDIMAALAEPVGRIIDAVRDLLEDTPPELVSDIAERGIVMTGGGSLLRGLAAATQTATGLPVRVADNALEAVAVGTGHALDMTAELRHSLISSDSFLRG